MAKKDSDEKTESSPTKCEDEECKANCQRCEKDTAFFHCVDCKMPYCISCMKHHDTFPTLRQHRRHHIGGTHHKNGKKHACRHVLKELYNDPSEVCTKHSGKLKNKTCDKCLSKLCEDCYRRHIKKKGCKRRREENEALELDCFQKELDEENDAMETHSHSKRAAGEGLIAHLMKITKVYNAKPSVVMQKMRSFLVILKRKIDKNQELVERSPENNHDYAKCDNEEFLKRKRLLHEQILVHALADFVINAPALPKIMSNINANIYKRFVDLIVEESSLDGPSSLATSPHKMITDPTFTPIVANHSNIAEIVDAVQSMKLPAWCDKASPNKSSSNGEAKSAISKSPQKTQPPYKDEKEPLADEELSVEEKRRRLRESKDKLIEEMKPLTAMAMRYQREFVYLTKQLMHLNKKQNLGQHKLAMEDDLLSDEAVELMDSPDTSDSDGDGQTTYTPNGAESEMVSNKWISRKKKIRMQDRLRNPSTTCLTHALLFGIKDLKKESKDEKEPSEKDDTIIEAGNDDAKQNRDKNSCSSAVSTDEDIDIDDSGEEYTEQDMVDNAKVMDPELIRLAREMGIKKPKKNRPCRYNNRNICAQKKVIYKENSQKSVSARLHEGKDTAKCVEWELEKLRDELAGTEESQHATSAKNNSNGNQNLDIKTVQEEPTKLIQNIAKNEKPRDLSGKTQDTIESQDSDAEIAHKLRNETISFPWHDDHNAPTSTRSVYIPKDTSRKPELSSQPRKDQENKGQTDLNTRKTSKTKTYKIRSRNVLKWPFAFQDIITNSMERVTEIPVPAPHKCEYISELWGDLWLLCPDTSVVIILDRTGEYSCTIDMNPNIVEPKSVIQATDTQAFVLDQKGVHLLKICEEKDMFQCIISGQFSYMCFSKKILYLLQYSELKIVTYINKGGSWSRKSDIFLKGGIILQELDSFCIYDNDEYICVFPNKPAISAWKFDMTGNKLDYFQICTDPMKEQLNICGYRGDDFVICPIGNRAYMFNFNIGIIPFHVAYNPMFIFYGRRNVVWYLDKSGSFLTKLNIRSSPREDQNLGELLISEALRMSIERKQKPDSNE